MRLDLFLTSTVPHCSRRTARLAIAAGEVRIDGRRARKGVSVAAGQIVQVPDALYDPPTLQANPELEVAVLHEDAAIIALDKPAGMPSHALRAAETETVANFLLARYPETAAVGSTQFEPGIVHRLDTETSGVLLAARTTDAYRSLRQQFSTHQVQKEYLAVVHGTVSRPAEVRAPIGHAPHHRGKMRVGAPSDPTARPAETSYRPLERCGNYTLLAVRISTGVMHQIRVHLASLGHPVAGDRLYGDPAMPDSAPRHLLHAAAVGFRHPSTGTWTEVRSTPPADFRGFLDAMRARAARRAMRRQDR